MTGYKIPKGFVEGYRNAIELYPEDSQYAWGMNAVVEALEVYPLEELDENPWHTGTPTEEGWYLLHTKETMTYRVAYMRDNLWLSTSDSYIRTDIVIAWQKIEEDA